ncbi:hypothetical protein [Amycolatopsis magusensis]|uniref:hypothetical protein n=1 Tax=Amycolatopsis magusensis TaxID=882444 RepID=UPI0037A114E2
MPQLRRPVLGEGPLKSLNDALHRLHGRAHHLSLGRIAKEIKNDKSNRHKISDETVRRAFSNPRIPPDENLLMIVGALARNVRGSTEALVEGECDRFSRLLQEAHAAEEAAAVSASAAEGAEEVSLVESDELRDAPGHEVAGVAVLTATPHSRLATLMINTLAREYDAESLEAWFDPKSPEDAMVLSELVVDVMAENGDVDNLRAKTDAGDAYAGQRLAEYFAEQGDQEELQALAHAHDSVARPFAQYQLNYWYWADHPSWYRSEPAEPLDVRIRRRQGPNG